jgi:hypothetical protein
VPRLVNACATPPIGYTREQATLDGGSIDEVARELHLLDEEAAHNGQTTTLSPAPRRRGWFGLFR